ncbi:MAG: hypothetical protein FWG83_01530 [Oscillospiraceae bacterium]|nr:hypothetical protein [Oscillospiraceae bacterium]
MNGTNNVTFSFNGVGTTMPGSVQVAVDGREPFMLVGGESVAMQFEEGVYNIRASIPYAGNEIGVVSAKLTVKRNTQYEVTYAWSAMMAAGKLTFRTFCSGGDYRINSNGIRVENKKSVRITTVFGKGNKAVTALIAISIASVILTISVALIFSYRESLNSNPHNERYWEEPNNREERTQENRPKIGYINEPFTITELYNYSGEIRRFTAIESIRITEVEERTTNTRLTFEIIGVVEGSDSLRVEVKCYDSDGFIMTTGTLSGSVSEGERFRVSDYIYVPADTARIEFVKDGSGEENE